MTHCLGQNLKEERFILDHNFKGSTPSLWFEVRNLAMKVDRTQGFKKGNVVIVLTQ